jgi:D-glycero-D-manno-heptose 1,7-bisphosphate phosphatase
MPVLFLDRDGTLIEDVGYPNDPAAVRLIPGAAEAVKTICDQYGYTPVVVSNQSGVARGWITADQMRAVHERFVDVFRDASGLTLPCYYCPHGTDEGCDCRKPKPGLLHKAAAELRLAGQHAIVVGDKPSDVGAGMAYGAETVWLSFGRTYPAPKAMPDCFAESWDDVMKWFLSDPLRVYAPARA